MDLTGLFDRLLDVLVGLEDCCVVFVKMLAVSNGVLCDQEDIERLSAEIQCGSADDDGKAASSGLANGGNCAMQFEVCESYVSF